MYKFEKLIDVRSEKFIINPLIAEVIACFNDRYGLKEFSVKWDLCELEQSELYCEVDKYRDKDGMCFYNGEQYSWEESKKYFVKNLRRFVLKIDDLGEKKWKCM